MPNRARPEPILLPDSLDWPRVVDLVRDATQALRRIRVGLAPTDAGWLVPAFEPIALDLGAIRVVLGARAPAGSDLGEVDDPPEVKVALGRDRRPIAPDAWPTLADDAELLHDRLVGLAAVALLDPRLANRLDGLAGEVRKVWSKVIGAASPTADEPVKPRQQRFQRTTAFRDAPIRRRKQGA